MTTMTVQEQLLILIKSDTMPSTLQDGKGSFPMWLIFTTPKINMSPTVIDVKGRTWTHIQDSYYYQLPTGKKCSIFFINRYE